MNSAERFEFTAIREDQKRIRGLVEQIDRRIDLLGAKFEERSSSETKPFSVAPVISVTKAEITGPPSLLPKVEPVATKVPPPLPKPQPTPISTASIHPIVPAEPVPPKVEVPVEAESFEFRLGTYWLVRIGIVILLTGLVFLGNYAYQHVVPMLGPGGKLTILALAGGALAGVGMWLERSRESLRSYARVLVAGGAATFYYTAYAAHFVERLRVIESPTIGGLLLLTLGGGIVWFAERRKSEATAVLAILLSYYTASINSIGGFTLFSNLLLTATAVFFLIRHGWLQLSFASLVGTYASFAFWRFQNVVTTGSFTSDLFGQSIGFLLGYWALFTVAGFFAKGATLSNAGRTAFLTLNNGAFFALGAQQFLFHHRGEFWMFSLGFGLALIGLALAVMRRFGQSSSIDGSLLSQGIGLVTLGLILKLTGPQLAATLAVESAILLACAKWRHRTIHHFGAALCALGAFGLAHVELLQSKEAAVALGISVSAILVFNAWWTKRLRAVTAETPFDGFAFYFAILGQWLLGITLWQAAAPAWQPVALGGVAALGAISLHTLRLPEVALPSQAFLPLGVVVVIGRYLFSRELEMWPAISIAGIALALTHGWPRAKSAQLSPRLADAIALGCAGCAMAVIAGWLHSVTKVDGWMVATSVAALAALAHGAVTRSWQIALAGQIFTALSIHAFVTEIMLGSPHLAAALAPIVNLALTAFSLERWVAPQFAAHENQLAARPLALAYRIAGTAMSLVWVFKFVPTPWQTTTLLGTGAVLLLGGTYFRRSEAVHWGTIFAVVGYLVFWLGGTPPQVAELFAFLAVPGSLRLAQHLVGERRVASETWSMLVGAAIVSVWWWVTRATVLYASPSHLTAIWAVLALIVFAMGLVLRERIYRLAGLSILALAVSRVFFIDVWKLETLYRILSFLVLGTVLMVLGFVYNRYGETMKRWL